MTSLRVEGESRPSPFCTAEGGDPLWRRFGSPPKLVGDLQNNDTKRLWKLDKSSQNLEGPGPNHLLRVANYTPGLQMPRLKNKNQCMPHY